MKDKSIARQKLVPPPKNMNIPMLIRNIHRTFSSSMDEECRRLGLGCGMRHVLFILSHLKEGERVTQRELAAFCKVTAPTMSITLLKMEQEGLITREKDSVDARKCYVSLTEKGVAADREIFELLIKKEAAMISVLSDEEKRFTEDILRKILISTEGGAVKNENI
ncbi:MAG: MarR family transcriptional regulator [Clostridia bacterium]|nr:MarR family transcriptional regulator [Clostridia bacterium]